MLRNILSAFFIVFIAIIKNSLGLRCGFIEKIYLPIATKILPKGFHVYAWIVIYYFFVYTLPFILSFFCCDDCCSLTEKKTNKKDSCCKEKLKDAHRLLVDGFSGFLAAVIVSTICKVPVETRLFFSIMFVVSRLMFVPFFVKKHLFISKTLLAISEGACLMLFFFSIAPEQTNRFIDFQAKSCTGKVLLKLWKKAERTDL